MTPVDLQQPSPPPRRLTVISPASDLGVTRYGPLGFDRDDNLHIADGSRVYRVDLAGRAEVALGAGPRRRTGVATQEDLNAQLYYPGGFAFDSHGNGYFCDSWNHVVLRRSADGSVQLFAGRWLGVGSGLGGYDAADEGRLATQVRLNRPRDLVVGPDDSVYIADSENGRIRRVTKDGLIRTVAMVADPSLGSAGTTLASPRGLAIDPTRSVLYVSDTGHDRVLGLDLASGRASLVAGGGGRGDGGDGGAAAAARLNAPRGVALGPNGVLVIADTGNHRLRQVVTTAGR